ncbi:MAG: hypothetical protein U0930_14275 [Pirellulales bacterium]
MQFKIASVLVITCIAAVILGAFLFTPIIAAVFIAITLMVISPSIWITGIVFARGLLRGFFIGGVAAGFIAHVVGLYYLILVGFSSSNLGESDTEARVMLLAIWSAPGVLAFIGGGLGSLTQWAVTPPKPKVAGCTTGESPTTQSPRDNLVASASTEHPLS